MKQLALILTLSVFSSSSFAFDLEDYATTYRATRDAYLKAANELKLAKFPFDHMNAMVKKLEDACYRVNWGESGRLINFQGLDNGSCNADGENPHRTGGSKLKDKSMKFGDQFAALLELTPITSNFPTFDSENAATQYRVRRDTYQRESNQKFLQETQAPWLLESIPNCKIKDQSLHDYVTANAGWFEDFFTTYRAVRDAFFKAAIELQLATGPYTAAEEAYKAAVVVYNTVSDCEDGLGRDSNVQYHDPYSWE